MARPAMLWVDLTQGERGSDRATIGLACRVYLPCGSEDLGEMIRSIQPCALSSIRLCHLFWARDAQGDQAQSSFLIIMLTEPHSESLAIWALRARVWDYFVKSISESAIMHSIMPLQREGGCQGCNRRTPRNPIMPAHHSPDNSILYTLGIITDRKGDSPSIRLHRSAS